MENEDESIRNYCFSTCRVIYDYCPGHETHHMAASFNYCHCLYCMDYKQIERTLGGNYEDYNHMCRQSKREVLPDGY